MARFVLEKITNFDVAGVIVTLLDRPPLIHLLSLLLRWQVIEVSLANHKLTTVCLLPSIPMSVQAALDEVDSVRALPVDGQRLDLLVGGAIVCRCPDLLAIVGLLVLLNHLLSFQFVFFLIILKLYKLPCAIYLHLEALENIGKYDSFVLPFLKIALKILHHLKNFLN